MTEQILVWIVFRGGLAKDWSRAAESIFFVIFSKEAEKDTNMKKWQKQKDHTDERSLFPALSIRRKEWTGNQSGSMKGVHTTFNQMEHMCIVGGYWGIILLTGE